MLFYHVAMVTPSYCAAILLLYHVAMVTAVVAVAYACAYITVSHGVGYAMTSLFSVQTPYLTVALDVVTSKKYFV